MPDEVTVTFRVPADLRAAFDAACKARDITASQFLRNAMRRYVEAVAEAQKETGNGR